MKKGRTQGRMFLHATINFFGQIVSRRSVAFAVFMQFPALLSSCVAVDPESAGREVIVMTKASAGGLLDLFFFDASQPFLLDSYQRITPEISPVYGLSGAGKKLAVAISARGGDIYDRSYVRALGDLSSDIFSLASERPVNPLLFGSAYLEEGRARTVTLQLKPALCCIRVKSLCCNFRERPYYGKSIENVKLWLVNAVSEYAPADGAEGRPVSWENYGCLGSDNPLLCQDGIGTVGQERIYPEVSLYCYPNPVDDETPGSPFTRLVVEGDIGAVHCYYPINLIRMTPGMAYDMDITLLRIGTSDPDLPAETGQIITEYSTVPWNEKEPHTEVF